MWVKCVFGYVLRDLHISKDSGKYKKNESMKETISLDRRFIEMYDSVCNYLN